MLPELSTLTYGQMRRAADELGVTVSSAILPDGLAGVYDDETGMILIDRRMTYRQKRCALAHELVHWQHGDTSCNPTQRCRTEARTRRETAMRLVNPVAYASAEGLYEGDVYQMADELEVTLQVLADYRLMLHDCVAP